MVNDRGYNMCEKKKKKKTDDDDDEDYEWHYAEFSKKNKEK